MHLLLVFVEVGLVGVLPLQLKFGLLLRRAVQGHVHSVASRAGAVVVVAFGAVVLVQVGPGLHVAVAEDGVGEAAEEVEDGAQEKDNLPLLPRLLEERRGGRKALTNPNGRREVKVKVAYVFGEGAHGVRGDDAADGGDGVGNGKDHARIRAGDVVYIYKQASAVKTATEKRKHGFQALE